MYNIHCVRSPVSNKLFKKCFFYMSIFLNRDHVVCRLKLEIESAIIAANEKNILLKTLVSHKGRPKRCEVI